MPTAAKILQIISHSVHVNANIHRPKGILHPTLLKICYWNQMYYYQLKTDFGTLWAARSLSITLNNFFKILEATVELNWEKIVVISK